MKNADPHYFYDVTVLQRNIAWDKQERLRGFFKQFPNMNLRFTNVDRELAGYELSTDNAHISVETYYRFLIQKLLPFYDKVLYLDSDIIINVISQSSTTSICRASYLAQCAISISLAI